MGLFLLWLMMGGVVAIIAGSKGYNWFLWLLYGAMIWPIALTHILVIGPADVARSAPPPLPGPVQDLPPRRRDTAPAPTPAPAMKSCPMCAEDIRAAALVCRFCGHKLEVIPPEQR